MKKRVLSISLMAMLVLVLVFFNRRFPAENTAILNLEKNQGKEISQGKNSDLSTSLRSVNSAEENDSQEKKNSDGWNVVVPEVEVEWHHKKRPDYQRTYSISERAITNKVSVNEKINPNSEEGLKQIQEVLGFTNPGVSLAVNASYPPDADGTITTRLKVSNEGIPVFGSEVILNQYPEEGSVTEELVADVIKELPGKLPKQPQVTAEAAFIKSTEDVQKATGESALEAKMLSSELVYFPGEKTVNLAWNLKLQTNAYLGEKGQEPPGQWNYLVDALTGNVLNKASEVQFGSSAGFNERGPALLKTGNSSALRSVSSLQTNPLQPEVIFKASGPGGNPKVFKRWEKSLEVVQNPNVSTPFFSMNTQRLVTLDLKEDVGNTGLIDELPEFVVTGRELNNFNNPDANNAHGYAEKALDLIRAYGYNSLDGRGFRLPSRVNVFNNFPNAFSFNGAVYYGDGGEDFYNMSSDVTIATHEINHGFTFFNARFFNTGQSGGLGESFSDIAATAVAFSINEPGVGFRIGERAVRPEGRFGRLGFLRDLCNPTIDGSSIDYFPNYDGLVDPHDSAGIMNKAFCLFSKKLAGSRFTHNQLRLAVIRAARVFYHANRTKWAPLSSFRSAAIGTMRSAKNLKFSPRERNHLKAAWEEVGVDSSILKYKINIHNMKNFSVSSYDFKADRFKCKHNICSLTVDAGYPSFLLMIVPKKLGLPVSIEGCDSYRYVGTPGVFDAYFCQVTTRGKNLEVWPKFN